MFLAEEHSDAGTAPLEVRDYLFEVVIQINREREPVVSLGGGGGGTIPQHLY